MLQYYTAHMHAMYRQTQINTDREFVKQSQLIKMHVCVKSFTVETTTTQIKVHQFKLKRDVKLQLTNQFKQR